LRCYDAKTGARRWTAVFEHAISDFDVSPDGKLIVGTTSLAESNLYDAANGKALRRISPDASLGDGVAFSADGTYVYALTTMCTKLERWPVAAPK
jgi:sugar lactone lactonase YvrE